MHQSLFMTLIVVFGTLYSTSKAQFNSNNVPHPPPEFCETLSSKGACRATIRRYRFNAANNECELFIYGGCPGINPKNIFRTQAECEKTCKRSIIQRRAFNSSAVTCEFEANLGKKCSLETITDFKSLKSCPGPPTVRLTRSQCINRGCCWHDSFEICFQKRSSLISAKCSARYVSNTGFWGKIVFQSDDYYPADWVGSITFNLPVNGGFCMVKDRLVPVYMGLSQETIDDRKIFLLPAKRDLLPGERVVAVFSGSFEESAYTSKQCDSINIPPSN